MSRRGFGVRYDGQGKRLNGARAMDVETFLTEYLRDRIGVLEDTIRNGDGSTDAVRQKMEMMEDELRRAGQATSEADRLRKQVQVLQGQLETYKTLASGSDPSAVAQTEEIGDLKMHIRDLEADLTMERRQSTMGSGGSAQEIQGFRRDLERLSRENTQLKDKLQTEVQMRMAAEDRAASGPDPLVPSSANEVRALREKLANFIVENKKLEKQQTSIREVMLAVQEQCEQKEEEMQKAQEEHEDEISKLTAKLEQARTEWLHEKESVDVRIQAGMSVIEDEKQKLHDMLEHVTTEFEKKDEECRAWIARAQNAERDLQLAHELAGVQVCMPSQGHCLTHRLLEDPGSLRVPSRHGAGYGAGYAPVQDNSLSCLCFAVVFVCPCRAANRASPAESSSSPQETEPFGTRAGNKQPCVCF